LTKTELQAQLRSNNVKLSLAKDERLTFKKAHQILQGKTLPKVYLDKIALYLKEKVS
jgi:hypothetical protein